MTTTEAPADGAVTYNPYAYEIHEDPYPTYARLREEAPLYHNAEMGFWALSRHADVIEGFRDNERLSSSHGVSLDPAASGPHAYRTMSFLAMDPPMHGRMRALVSRGFTPRRVAHATGTQNSGLSLFVQDDRLVFDYNAFDAHTIVESTIPVPAGESELTLRVRRLEGQTGSASIEIDGVECGTAELPLLMGIISSVGASVGYDEGSAVSARYEAPFAYSGTLREVVIQASPERYADTDASDAAAGMARQ